MIRTAGAKKSSGPLSCMKTEPLLFMSPHVFNSQDFISHGPSPTLTYLTPTRSLSIYTSGDFVILRKKHASTSAYLANSACSPLGTFVALAGQASFTDRYLLLLGK